ncbi:MAG TPA: TlpA disulfide reductase family protein [Puia sp.]|nr:TlpA disulfide reductase family protein [Puia sp.]
MRSAFQLVPLVLVLSSTVTAQQNQISPLDIGDPAPALHVHEWLKGKPVERFEKGRMYVVEFWATWCEPCRRSIPRLTKLVRKFRKKVDIIGIDVYEQATGSEKIQRFVDSMGHRMKYRVAREDSNSMETSWLAPAGQRPIPVAFVINAEGQIAWIGHPLDLDHVFANIVNNDWNVLDAYARRNLERHLDELGHETNDSVTEFVGSRSDFYGKPDLVLDTIQRVVSIEPGLKYESITAFNTFSALLKLNPKEAYNYGKGLLSIPANNHPSYDAIIGNIQGLSDKLTLPAEIYELGAEAWQLKIDEIRSYDRELLHAFEVYHEMADWYWRGNNRAKAIKAEKRAIRALKKEPNNYLNLRAFS